VAVRGLESGWLMKIAVVTLDLRRFQDAHEGM
jgi:hypothetical protein